MDYTWKPNNRNDVPERTTELAFGWRVANFEAFIFRIDDPRELSAAGEKIFQPFVYLAAGIGRGKNFHCQVRRNWKELFRGSSEA